MRGTILALVMLMLAATVTASSAQATEQPILAGPWSMDQEGYGHVKPKRIFNGGDPTGLVTHIRWLTWGQRKAIGTGMAEKWVGPHQDVRRRNTAAHAHRPIPARQLQRTTGL